LAKASFSRALALQPQMSEAAAALAGLNVKGDPDEALRLAGNALQTDAGLPSANLARARALLAKGDTRQGEAVLQDVLRHDPASLPALGMLLNLYSRQGKTQEAVQQISGLLQHESRNAGLHFLLALGYFNLKDLDKSEAGVRQALALDPKTPQAYALLANIHFARGSVEKAKTDLRTAIAASPRNPSSYTALATQYEKENNWEEAKRLFEKARELDPASPYIAAELAFLYLEHGGDVNVAVSLAQAAKQAMPKSPVAADALGWAYYKLGSLEPALTQLKQAAQQSPDNPMYQYHLGMAYMASRRADLARKSLQAALKSGPGFLDAANARAALDKLAAAPL
jgi:tetratricopeptide (TPR) repeat protein